MINENNRRTQDEFLGFGNNFIQNLINYRDEDDDRSRLKLSEWLKNCQNSDSICFLDITVFGDDKNIENATTILFATSRKHSKQYENRLDEYTKEGFAIAAHPSFFSGLQDITENKEPHLLYHKFPDNSYKKYMPQNIFNVEIIDTYKTKLESAAFVQNRQKTIEEQWEKFKSIYGRAIKNNELLSLRGSPPKHILAFPVGIKDSTENYNISSCVFLGIDCSANEEMVKNIARHIALSMVQMHGLSRAYKYGFDKGEDKGHEHSIMAFGHQVKTLTGGISGEQKKWLFPLTALSKFCGSDDAVIETLLNGARDKGLLCEVTPVPQLLESLGRSMSFWSLSHSRSALDIPDMFFDNFAQLVSKSAEFAHSLRLASEFARKDMSNNGNLLRLTRFPKIKIVADDGNSNRQCEKIAERNQIYVVIHGLMSWRINGDMFRKNGSSDFEMDSRNMIFWQELAGLIRLFAIIIEGAIEYRPQRDADGKAPKAEIVFNVTQASHSGGRIRITASNSCQPMADRQQDPSRYLGMHGTQIREFLCNRFLQTLAPKMPIDVIEEDTLYTIALEINEPKWIRLGCSDE